MGGSARATECASAKVMSSAVVCRSTASTARANRACQKSSRSSRWMNAPLVGKITLRCISRSYAVCGSYLPSRRRKRGAKPTIGRTPLRSALSHRSCASRKTTQPKYRSSSAMKTPMVGACGAGRSRFERRFSVYSSTTSRFGLAASILRSHNGGSRATSDQTIRICAAAGHASHASTHFHRHASRMKVLRMTVNVFRSDWSAWCMKPCSARCFGKLSSDAARESTSCVVVTLAVRLRCGSMEARSGSGTQPLLASAKTSSCSGTV
mmetsp:Transcript_19917/g.61951  ORF Transcript_19917/g.61951 Transcript_19917/m.61951 type:complete len:266 (-) Transcript_19917:254-1051(-)